MTSFFFSRVLMVPYLYYRYAVYAAVSLLKVPFNIPIYCNVASISFMLLQWYWFNFIIRHLIKRLFVYCDRTGGVYQQQKISWNYGHFLSFYKNVRQWSIYLAIIFCILLHGESKAWLCEIFENILLFQNKKILNLILNCEIVMLWCRDNFWYILMNLKSKLIKPFWLSFKILGTANIKHQNA